MNNGVIEALIKEADFDWRKNEKGAISIIKMNTEYVTPDGETHYWRMPTKESGLCTGRWFPHLKEASYQGSDVIIKGWLKDKFPEVDIVYPKESEINPITKEFLTETYKRLYEVATDSLAKDLFLEYFSPCKDIDLSVRIIPGDGFLHHDGSIQANASFESLGKFRKKIGSTNFVLHAQTWGENHGYSGGIYLRGQIDSLEPEMIVVAAPFIYFDVDRSVPMQQRFISVKELRDFPFHLEPFDIYIDGRKWRGLKSIKCEYHVDEHYKELDQIISSRLSKIKNIGLEIEEMPNGRYRLVPE